MAKIKRLRFFAGPNGSGKSTLFEVIAAQFSTGLFINSDEIESSISQKGFINLSAFGLKLTQADLEDSIYFLIVLICSLRHVLTDMRLQY